MTKLKYEKPRNPNSRGTKLQTRASDEQEMIILEKAAKYCPKKNGDPNVSLYLLLAALNYEPKKGDLEK